MGESEEGSARSSSGSWKSDESIMTVALGRRSLLHLVGLKYAVLGDGAMLLSWVSLCLYKYGFSRVWNCMTRSGSFKCVRGRRRGDRLMGNVVLSPPWYSLTFEAHRNAVIAASVLCVSDRQVSSSTMKQEGSANVPSKVLRQALKVESLTFQFYHCIHSSSRVLSTHRGIERSQRQMDTCTAPNGANSPKVSLELSLAANKKVQPVNGLPPTLAASSPSS